MRDYKHLTVFPGEEKPLLDQARDVSGLSLNQIIVKGAVETAGRIVAESKAAGRVTNVEPLPEKLLQEIYSRPDRDPKGEAHLVKRQAKGVRD